MKKIVFILFLFPLTIHGLDISLGLKIGYKPTYYLTSVIQTTPLFQLTANSAVENLFQSLNYGVILDFTYFRLDIEHESTFRMITYKNIEDESILYPVINNYFSTNIYNQALTSTFSVSLMFKYPIQLLSVHFWPAIGIKFSNLYYLDKLGSGSNEINESTGYIYYDFYVFSGFGCDIDLAPGFSLVPSILIGYNLTPWTKNVVYTDESYYGYQFTFEIGLLYQL
ncbi:MAG: hypothetical protein A2Y33_03690 [Spirochaetes bacterium GWF1_51_8]|nr:MAG: hypothetical protein A2Y33_03690 [Spirochaetes bacterium GWF1_51_8]